MRDRERPGPSENQASRNQEFSESTSAGVSTEAGNQGYFASPLPDSLLPTFFIKFDLSHYLIHI